MSQNPETLKTTCLYEHHRALGARMVEFAGWSMPIQYGSILEEHQAVRTAAGLFDVSHMARIEFSGPDCIPYLQRLFTCDVERLEPGHARYTLLCIEHGGILDDTLLYCRWKDSFWMVCNAANTPAVLDWLHQWKDPNHRVTLEDRTAATGMIALQGPAAEEHLAALADAALVRTLAYFRWTQAPVVGVQTLLSRTGYTGEDGFELIAPAEHVPALWQALVNSGVMPCGLGARDTLRLEAALPLHGNEITPQTTPVHAGLLWAVALDKGPFLGREAIAKAREEGTAERLVGFEVTGRGIPRPHCPILAQGKVVGTASSGGFAPTLRKGIGLGYVSADLAHPNVDVAIDIRGAIVPARTVRRPFYKRPA